jgi:hypothetical protein
VSPTHARAGTTLTISSKTDCPAPFDKKYGKPVYALAWFDYAKPNQTDNSANREQRRARLHSDRSWTLRMRIPQHIARRPVVVAAVCMAPTSTGLESYFLYPEGINVDVN